MKQSSKNKMLLNSTSILTEHSFCFSNISSETDEGFAGFSQVSILYLHPFVLLLAAREQVIYFSTMKASFFKST